MYVKRLMNGEEVQLALKGAVKEWTVVWEMLRLGKDIQLRGCDDPWHTQIDIRRWIKKNVDKYPHLKNAKTRCFVKEQRVVVYFIPFLDSREDLPD